MRIIRMPIYTLRPYERGIQETLGKYSGSVTPGLGFQIPIVHIIRVRDVREHTTSIPAQSVITKDNVDIRIDGIMSSHPTVSSKVWDEMDRERLAIGQPTFSHSV